MNRSATAFDVAALSYDEEFEAIPQTRRLRGIIHSVAARFFPPGGRILELNCGTGTDAIALAGLGFRVHATDASGEMLARAAKKVEESNVRSRITLQQMSFAEISSHSGISYSGVFSNLGGLNCTNDLPAVSRRLADLVDPGAFFIVCFISRFSLWETTSFLARGDFRSAFRRFSPDPLPVPVAGQPVPVSLYSPLAVASQFRPMFDSVYLQGLNIFSPPPSSRSAYRLLGNGARLLEGIDDLLSRLPPFSSIGDHFLMVLRRTNV